MRLTYINNGESGAVSVIYPIRRETNMNTGNDTTSPSSFLLPDILELAKIGTWEFNMADGLVTGCPLFKKLFDLQELPMFNGYHILRKIARDQRSDFKRAIAETAIGNALSIEIALGRHKMTWLKISGKLFYSSENNTTKMAGIVEDITESKVRENAKNNMISYLSHELRSPLTTLKLYIQRSVLLAKENGQDVIANFLKKANAQVSSMNTLTNTYLDQAAMENGGFKLDISRFDITELISEVVADISFQHPDYEVESKMPTTLFLHADRTKIGLAIINLVKNAIKYSSSNSKVSIQCIQQADFALIIVKDHGIGIEKNNLKKLFNRFYRVKEPATRGISGYGIGLHLVKNIVIAHKGQIAVTSNPNKGSEFLFTLPSENLADDTVHL